MKVDGKQLFDLARREGGFSIRHDGSVPTECFAVSQVGYEMAVKFNEFSSIPTLIEIYADMYDRQIRTGDRLLGGWIDKGTNTFYLDVSDVVNSLRLALQLGRERGQIAVFGLGDGELYYCDPPDDYKEIFGI